MLIEARPQEEWAVIGIGLNVDTTLDELAHDLRGTASSLRIASGGPVDREAALDALLERLAGVDRAPGEPGPGRRSLPRARCPSRTAHRLGLRPGATRGRGARHRRRWGAGGVHRRWRARAARCRRGTSGAAPERRRPALGLPLSCRAVSCKSAAIGPQFPTPDIAPYRSPSKPCLSGRRYHLRYGPNPP